MSDRLQDASTRLAARLKAFASQAAVYRRAGASCPLQVTAGQVLLRVSDGQGNARTERTERDFTFTSADLVLGGEEAGPRHGDRVEFLGSLWEVMPYGDEPPTRDCDPYGTETRVHTKYVGPA